MVCVACIRHVWLYAVTQLRIALGRPVLCGGGAALGAEQRGYGTGFEGGLVSPVERAGQEISGSIEPACTLLRGAHTRHCLIRLLGRTLLLGQVVWEVYILLHWHQAVLWEGDHYLKAHI